MKCLIVWLIVASTSQAMVQQEIKGIMPDASKLLGNAKLEPKKSEKKMKLTIRFVDPNGKQVVPNNTPIRLKIWSPGSISGSLNAAQVKPNHIYDLQSIDGAVTVEVLSTYLEKLEVELPKEYSTSGPLISRRIARHFPQFQPFTDLELRWNNRTFRFVVQKTAERACRYFGKITFSDGTPAANVKFQIQKNIYNQAHKNKGWNFITNASTDASGNFDVALFPGVYWIRYWQDLRCITPKDLHFEIANENPTVQRNIQLKTKIVNGRVIDFNGEPIAGAYISPFGRELHLFPKPRVYQSDKQGRFQIRYGNRGFWIQNSWCAVSSDGKLAGVIQKGSVEGQELGEIVFVCLPQTPFKFSRWISVKTYFPKLLPEYQKFQQKRMASKAKQAKAIIQRSIIAQSGMPHQIPKTKFVLYHFVTSAGNWPVVKSHSTNLSDRFPSEKIRYFAVFQNTVENSRMARNRSFDPLTNLFIPIGQKNPFEEYEYTSFSPVFLLHNRSKNQKEPEGFFFETYQEAAKKIKQLTEQNDQRKSKENEK